MLKSAACLWHICFKVRSLCGFPYRFCNGFKLNSSVTWIRYVESAESCFVWKWLLLRCASNIINSQLHLWQWTFLANVTVHLLHDFCLFLLEYGALDGFDRVFVVCLLQLWTAWSEPVVNITSLQMKPCSLLTGRPRLADADGVDMDGVNDCPPPDGFKLDYTPK